MTAKLKSAIEKSNGYKTKAAALIYLLFTLAGEKVPFLSDNSEQITVVIDFLIFSGLLHDAWRNRKKIIEFVKNIFKKKT